MKGIYLVTGDCVHNDLYDVVEQAVKAGLCCVQLREKHADTRTFVERAVTLKKLLENSGTPLVINDRVDIALAAGAHGVHIGQSDMHYDKARQLMGPKAIIGLSVETWEDVEAAQNLDLAYIGASPVFATPTKTDTKTPWGLDGLRKIKAFSRHPVVAIGGLNTGNTCDVVNAGADAVAVVSAVCSARDPFKAASDLNKIFTQANNRRKI